MQHFIILQGIIFQFYHLTEFWETALFQVKHFIQHNICLSKDSFPMLIIARLHPQTFKMSLVAVRKFRWNKWDTVQHMDLYSCQAIVPNPVNCFPPRTIEFSSSKRSVWNSRTVNVDFSVQRMGQSKRVSMNAPKAIINCNWLLLVFEQNKCRGIL